MESFLNRFRQPLIFLALTFGIVFSLVSSFALRFDFVLPPGERANLLWGLVLCLPLKLAVFHIALIHRGWWGIVGVRDFKRILYANAAASILCAFIILSLHGLSYPRTVHILDFLICFSIISGSRLLIRVYRDASQRRSTGKNVKNVLIYGAGWAGAGVAREIYANPRLNYRVVGFLDDNPNKQNEMLVGLPVLGDGRAAILIVQHAAKRGRKIDEILIAMPSATGQQMRDAVANCRAAGVACRTLPSIGDLLTETGLTQQIREVSVEDLLARDPVQLDEAGIRDAFANKVVLVTGAAGSIGSEICRQIAALGPRRLVALDQAESALYNIDLELRRRWPTLPIAAEIGDIRDATRIDEIICKHDVECIFHAAAYKHVPLMEEHVLEAVQNNVLGTWNVVEAAARLKVESFVLISSDKAVNPTNVMGATKRATELIVSHFAKQSQTKFVAVRFGNVLASNGSVVPLFQSQIAAGGPVTVTHPEVRRFFMTVREAVQLVLQASTMGKGSEIFVLDMGEPVRILDLARNMIRLSGLEPDKDIEIRFVGLRPGEKLFEELLIASENILPTYHEKIKIFSGSQQVLRPMNRWMAELRTNIASRDRDAIISSLVEIVPEYQVSRRWTSSAGKLRVKTAVAS